MATRSVAPHSRAYFRSHHYLKEKEGALYLMGPEQFAETMDALGVGNDTLVIAYDSFSGLHVTRFGGR
jgi:3-mercaptopyruvate sulfurtransferase SseA